MFDNGPQYTADSFKQFAKEYGFQHKTSSPYFPQSNGEAERAVRTIKELLNKSDDPNLALLAYRTTPIQGGQFSPAELLMSRKLRTTVPTTRAARTPRVPKQSLVRSREQEQKDNQKQAFDHHHGVRKLTDLSPGDTVWLPERQQEATVEDEVAPESYALVTSEGGSYRRNRQAINKLPDPSPQVETATCRHSSSITSDSPKAKLQRI